MKKVLFLLLMAYSACAQSPWSQLPNFPGTPRMSACMFMINDVVYAGTGRDNTGPFVIHKDFYKYDPSTNSWTPIASLPSERWISTAFSIGSKGYVALGAGQMGGLSELWEYNAFSNTWTQKASLPAANRWGAFSFVINGRAYVGGGLNATDHNDLWEYNPIQNSWTPKASFPLPRHTAIAFSIGNKGYMGLGRGTTYYDDFYEYDPVTNSWTPKAIFPGGARYIGTGFSLGTKGYAGLGLTTSSTNPHQNDFWQYDPILNTWTMIPAIPGVPRSHCAATSNGNKAYIMGGNYQLSLNDFYSVSIGNITGIKPTNSEKTFSIYTSENKVIINNWGEIPFEVLLTDLVGKTVFTGIIKAGKQEIDSKNLSTNLIIYRITETNKNVSIGKLLIAE